MGTPYEQGYSAENDLFNRLVDIDFTGKRAYKSQGPYDLIMVHESIRPLLIEVKYYKAMTRTFEDSVNLKVLKRLKKKVNTDKLIRTAKQTNCYPLFAFKIRNVGYMFYRLDINKHQVATFKNIRFLLGFCKLSEPFS